jgi:transcription-repair coupling factor (superfamily II helicase)
LNEELIQEDRLRLELYRRLSLCESTSEVYEIEVEIADKFGKLDSITRAFVDVIVMKVLAREKGVFKAESKDDDDIVGVAMGWLKV